MRHLMYATVTPDTTRGRPDRFTLKPAPGVGMSAPGTRQRRTTDPVAEAVNTVGDMIEQLSAAMTAEELQQFWWQLTTGLIAGLVEGASAAVEAAA